MTTLFIIKLIHIASAILSISGFIFRAILKMQDSVRLNKKFFKIAPHVIDTILLVSALILAVSLSINPIEQIWLMGKICAVVVYIALGIVFFRFAQTRQQHYLSLFLAISVFIYIIFVALSKQLFPINLI